MSDVCLVYDCLYPYTVGGAERWYRNLGERLARDGHRVTLLTLRQWDRDDEPRVPGVDVRAVGPRMDLYTPSGRRRILPPLVFGAGVLAHLLRRGGRYEVVHTASFPYFSLLAAALVRPLHRFRLVVDWHEAWTREYWEEYLGRVGGTIGWRVQQLCLRVPHVAFCFSRLHERRLRAWGVNAPLNVLEGQYTGDAERPHPEPPEDDIVFAGRHIPEKRVTVLPAAIAVLRRDLPGIRCEIFGDGPERARVLELIEQEGVDDAVVAPGFVERTRLDSAMRHALCHVLPSRREGYGQVVLEAAARGTPTVVVRGEDNAAVELVEDGVNGMIAESDSPEDLAAAILRVHAAGPPLRESTADWFARNAGRLSLSSSLDSVAASYASARS